ncbi:Phosphatase DCR2 [Paramyrothecium foliicola]|nr:Phosphatase DCR2 [Paramyrothecium foliicola]
MLPSKVSALPGTTPRAHDTVITDLTISFSSPTDPLGTCPSEPSTWRRIEKDLHLRSHEQSAWLQVLQVEKHGLITDDLVVSDIRIGHQDPSSDSDGPWESRPGGIWVLKSGYTGDIHRTVTGVDILFGADAVDPRPQWNLLSQPLLLHTHSGLPNARLTIRHGKPRPRVDSPALRTRKNGKFKIVQISDTHTVTGFGVCRDSMDVNGQPLPESEADPLTMKFMGEILDVEKPDLVILTGDQLHHDILDSQSSLFKVVAPLIARSIPFAAVFGNHDDEGTYALSRAAQMSLLQDLPHSLCQPGPEDVDGIGNYYLEVFGPEQSGIPLATLFLLDSHGQISRSELQNERKKYLSQGHFHLSLAFQYIPLPEYGDENLIIKGGHRGEPTEGPKYNSHFYSALAKAGVVAVGCGHDHVNDFCALRPQDGTSTGLAPWLCYAGCSGFGGYGMYGTKRYHRRARIWELDTSVGSLKTWKRLEYAKERVDELLLVDAGAVVS